MEIEAILAISMFTIAILGLLSGYPVALVLGGVAIFFALLGITLDVFSVGSLRAFSSRVIGIMENQLLLAVPLFVVMGTVLERSKIAEDLLKSMSYLLRNVKGGLGFTVILVGALLAASTGIVGATVVTMTLIALPSMLKQGYNPKLASGTIAASGTLGQIIPPSIVLILLADAISNANASAANRPGIDAQTVSVGDLFAGALIPGILLVLLYLVWMAVNAIFWSDRSGNAQNAILDKNTPTIRELSLSLGAPLALIIAVLGSILAGVASPTEAAAIGATGAIYLSGTKLTSADKAWHSKLNFMGFITLLLLFTLRISFGNLTAPNLSAPLAGAVIQICGVILLILFMLGFAISLLTLMRSNSGKAAISSAANLSAMVFFILLGASLFALIFRKLDGDVLIEMALLNLPGGAWGALATTMLIMFILGFFLDFIEIVFVIVPLVAPPLIMAGYDPIWLAILFALNLQTSFLTPPFGFALFYLRGVARQSVSTRDIWHGVIPFIGLQLIILALVIFIPGLATYLPNILR